MKLKHFIFVLALSMPVSAMADTAGFWIGAGSWDHGAEGTFRDTTDINQTIDLDSDLGLKDEEEGYVFAVIEHPVPFLPNIRFYSSKQTNKGTGTLTVNTELGGVPFTASTSVASVMDLDHTDITAYWQILDNVVEFDLGLTARSFDGEIEIVEVGNPSNRGFETIDETIPMLYAKLAVGLPITGLSIGVEGNFIGVGDNKLTDYSAKISYQSDYFFGIEGGVRSQTLELDDVDGIFSDFTFEGPFVAAFLHF